MAFLQSLLIVVFGLLFQLQLFLKNNIVLVFLLFFLFILSMVRFLDDSNIFYFSPELSKTHSFEVHMIVVSHVCPNPRLDLLS